MQESVAFRQATQRLAAGKPLEAEGLLVETAQAAERALGPTSALHASAQFELAKLRLLLGDLPRALDALRAACRIEPRTPSEQRERLMYLLNLGELLERTGQLEEAENVLRQGLGERATFYGVDHPGYAFGLEPLVALKLAQGRPNDARCLAEQAVHVLSEARHPRLPELIALHASTLVASGRDDVYSFARSLELPGFLQLSSVVLERAELASPEHALALLRALWPELQCRLGSDHELLVRTAVAIANRARDLGDHEARMAALSWLCTRLRVRGDRQGALDAQLGLALAESDAGGVERAERSYRRALELASELGASQRSKVLRNLGLFLAHSGRRAEAEPLFESARDEAAADDRERARALIALGIFRQHGGEREAARGLIEQGLELLPRSDPDALCGRSHLEAIERERACGCDEPRA